MVQPDLILVQKDNRYVLHSRPFDNLFRKIERGEPIEAITNSSDLSKERIVAKLGKYLDNLIEIKEDFLKTYSSTAPFGNVLSSLLGAILGYEIGTSLPRIGNYVFSDPLLGLLFGATGAAVGYIASRFWYRKTREWNSKDLEILIRSKEKLDGAIRPYVRDKVDKIPENLHWTFELE